MVAVQFQRAQARYPTHVEVLRLLPLESRGQDEDANQGCERNYAAGNKSTPVAPDNMCHAMCHVASPKVIQTTNAAGFIAFRQRLAFRAMARLSVR
jgi:hypothetical protein